MAQDQLVMRMVDELASFKEAMIDKLNKIEEILLARERRLTRVEEELVLLKRLFKDVNRLSVQRTMKLQFRNTISQKILTCEQIKGEGNRFVEVVLVDDSTGNIIVDGPEASATVQIVVLKGEADEAFDGDDWTVEEFDEHIVPEMEGKKPLLAGNVRLRLERGVAVLDNIKFRHHAIKVMPPLCRIGARIVDKFDGVRIKEAKTGFFKVRDFRNKYFEKRKTPSLGDDVCRLVNIHRGGKIEERLRGNKISKVEDFLIRLLRDPEGLKSIVKLAAKKWEVTVKNARACAIDKKMYCYVNSDHKTGIVFNILGQVLGLYLQGQYAPTKMLSKNHEGDVEELLASACAHWEDVKQFDDVNSLQQHFTVLSSTMINSIGETAGPEDLDSFFADARTDIDAMLQSSSYSLDLDTFFEGLELDYQFPDQNDDGNMQQLNRVINADERAAVTRVESEVVRRPKSWNILLCVWRWSARIKRVSAVCNHHIRKKQKLRY